MMDKLKKITYKLVTQTPIALPCQGTMDGRLIIPGSALKGLTRLNFEKLQNRACSEQRKYVDDTRDMLFGVAKQEYASHGHLLVTDAICENSTSVEPIPIVDFYPRHSQLIIPEGTEFVGSVAFTGIPNGIQRSMALSMILDIEILGLALRPGYTNKVDVEIIDRSKPIVFISYTWENDVHISWVTSLVMRLMENDIDVIFDRFCPEFNKDLPQDKKNEWMIRSINTSDKILAVMTPQYKEKAEKGIGGVGFEYNRLLSEKDLVSERLKRYVVVLKSGDKNVSVPYLFLDCPTIDMHTAIVTDASLRDLIRIILA